MAKFRQFGNIMQAFGKFLKAYISIWQKFIPSLVTFHALLVQQQQQQHQPRGAFILSARVGGFENLANREYLKYSDIVK